MLFRSHISLELIKISEIVINFGSAAIEECVMMNTPVIDFNIKPFEKIFKSLYEYKFVKNFESQFKEKEFKEAINYLVRSDFKKEFNKAQEKNLFNNNFKSSQKILKFILKDNYL